MLYRPREVTAAAWANILVGILAFPAAVFWFGNHAYTIGGESPFRSDPAFAEYNAWVVSTWLLEWVGGLVQIASSIALLKMRDTGRIFLIAFSISAILVSMVGLLWTTHMALTWRLRTNTLPAIAVEDWFCYSLLGGLVRVAFSGLTLNALTRPAVIASFWARPANIEEQPAIK